jgi:hypothetical protein
LVVVRPSPIQEIIMRLLIPLRGLFAVCLGSLAVTPGTAPLAEEAAVRMYECNQGGEITFSDVPCAGTERRVELDYAQPDPAQAQAAAVAAQAAEDRAGTLAQAQLLDAEVLNLEQHISNLEHERDARIGALRDQLAQGTENPDTDAWQAAINQQIRSATDNYSDSILAARARLDALRAERQALGGRPPR